SKKNAILIAPEVMFDQASSEPGGFAQADLFYNMLDEIMTQLGDKVGGATLWDLSQIIISSHSGGYEAAADIVTVGGAWTNELWLLDSLYGNTDDFDGWIDSDDDKSYFASTPWGMRFANIYTVGGGTMGYSQAMATRAAGWFDAKSVVLDDRSGKTLTDADF